VDAIGPTSLSQGKLEVGRRSNKLLKLRLHKTFLDLDASAPRPTRLMGPGLWAQTAFAERARRSKLEMWFRVVIEGFSRSHRWF
jgi:hypothetical protein